jgi:pimeloyl-ACP methyl ester carboxylesterase
VPELSIYSSPAGKARCMALYQAALVHWPVSYESLDVPTRFGGTHIIASGSAAGGRDAPSLVLLHGQWATATMWSSMIAHLSRAYRVFAVDQIDDVGMSVPCQIQASRSNYAAWLADVFDQLEIARAGIVGLSYGGFLALNFALSAPQRVKQLVLLSPGVPSFGKPTMAWAIHGLPMTLFPSRRTAEWLVQGMSVRGYSTADPECEQLVAAAMSLRSRIPFRPAFADDEFADLKTPALLIIGEKEGMYDAQAAVARARQLIPSIESEIIPNAGHMLTRDQPEKVIARILRFLVI